MLNFCRKHLPNASALTAPLGRMFVGYTKNNKKLLQWTEETSLAFFTSRDSLANLATLSFPERDAYISLVCDASDVAVGGALNQIVKRELNLQRFFSKVLNAAQINYSTFD